MKNLKLNIGMAILILLTSINIANAANVVVFYNGAYVDAGAASNSEATNEIATLIAQGHNVTTFTGITTADINIATAGQDVLVIPELEDGNLISVLDAAAQTAIFNFVSAGGNLIIHGTYGNDAVNLLNSVFTYTLVRGAGDLDGLVLTGPTALTGQDGTYPVATASVPAGANILYINGTNTAVFDATVGTGHVKFLAFDWFNAAPNGTQDAGWLTVLANSVRATAAPASIPTLSEWVIILLSLSLGFVAFRESKNMSESGVIKSVRNSA